MSTKKQRLSRLYTYTIEMQTLNGEWAAVWESKDRDAAERLLNTEWAHVDRTFRVIETIQTRQVILLREASEAES